MIIYYREEFTDSNNFISKKIVKKNVGGEALRQRVVLLEQDVTKYIHDQKLSPLQQTSDNCRSEPDEDNRNPHNLQLPFRQ
jgi:hypothetical protein